MMVEPKTTIRRVTSSNGRTWHTNAHGATDYIFNPVFMTFFILCVVLYATLMQPSEETKLPVPAQMILWGGLIMTSLVWLVVSVWLSVLAFDRGITKAIYTPLLLLPLVLINTFLGEFVLSVFNEGFQGSYGSKLENIVQNTIILVAFDIMHERFVVPQHPKYLPSGSNAVAAGNQPAPARPTERHTLSSPQPDIEQVAPPEVLQPSHEPGPDAEGPEPQNVVKVANERLDPSAILWVKSEDHYLNIQLRNRSLMVRGKLRTVVKELGDGLGAQINRSAWVGYSAIRTLDEQANGVFEIHLEDDTVHRVASSRRLIFKQNYERYMAARS